MINLQANPFFASCSWDKNDKQEKELKKKWFMKFSDLPLGIRMGLMSSKTGEYILKLKENFGIKNNNELGEISRIIREYFTEKKDRKNFIQETTYRVRKKLSIKSHRIADLIREIFKIITLVEEIGREKIANEYEVLALMDAVNKYETVAKQLVTSEKIVSEERKKEVLPSVKNWLDDYFEKMGTGKHGALERNRYLFKTLNTQKLNKDERKKVAVIVEAYDAGTKILISKKGNSEIVFDNLNVNTGIKSKLDESLSQEKDGLDKFLIKKKNNQSFIERDKKNINHIKLENKMKIRDNKKELKEESIDLSNIKNKKKTVTNKEDRNILNLNEFVD